MRLFLVTFVSFYISAFFVYSYNAYPATQKYAELRFKLLAPRSDELFNKLHTRLDKSIEHDHIISKRMLSREGAMPGSKAPSDEYFQKQKDFEDANNKRKDALERLHDPQKKATSSTKKEYDQAFNKYMKASIGLENAKIDKLEQGHSDKGTQSSPHDSWQRHVLPHGKSDSYSNQKVRKPSQELTSGSTGRERVEDSAGPLTKVPIQRFSHPLSQFKTSAQFLREKATQTDPSPERTEVRKSSKSKRSGDEPERQSPSKKQRTRSPSDGQGGVSKSPTQTSTPMRHHSRQAGTRASLERGCKKSPGTVHKRTARDLRM